MMFATVDSEILSGFTVGSRNHEEMGLICCLQMIRRSFVSLVVNNFATCDAFSYVLKWCRS